MKFESNKNLEYSFEFEIEHNLNKAETTKFSKSIFNLNRQDDDEEDNDENVEKETIGKEKDKDVMSAMERVLKKNKFKYELHDIKEAKPDEKEFTVVHDLDNTHRKDSLFIENRRESILADIIRKESLIDNDRHDHERLNSLKSSNQTKSNELQINNTVNNINNMNNLNIEELVKRTSITSFPKIDIEKDIIQKNKESVNEINENNYEIANENYEINNENYETEVKYTGTNTTNKQTNRNNNEVYFDEEILSKINNISYATSKILLIINK